MTGRSRIGLGLAMVVVASSSVAAQERSTVEVLVMTAGPGGMPGHKVESVGADGSVVLRPMEVPPQIRGLFARAEGYYLLLPISDKPAGVLRVQVQEIGGDGVLHLARSAEAIGALKAGDSVLLLRPPAASTAQLKALPALIPLDGAAADNIDATQLARRARSMNNLKQIGLAMHNFQDAVGSFPPAVILGPDGKPWHSWRVLLLPFLEQAALYNQYDFSQPWNSEKNLKLLDAMPDVYRDPIHDGDRGHFTHYVVLTSKDDGQQTGAAFRANGPRQTDPMRTPMGHGVKLPEFTDGTSNTMLVVPADPARKIPWTSPEDVLIEPGPTGKYAEFGKSDGIPTFFTRNGLKGGEGVAPILLADGAVRLIVSSINPAVSHALQTRNGGEVIAIEAIPSDSTRSIPSIRVLRIENDGGRARATLDEYKP